MAAWVLSAPVFSALIIDADDAARGAIEGTLQPFGFEFANSQDAPEAMTLARTATPDIIFLRVELPSASGFSVCNKLRRNEETKYIPLVMYASDVTDDVFDQHKNLKTHADEYLKLPLDNRWFQHIVRIDEFHQCAACMAYADTIATSSRTRHQDRCSGA